MAKVRTSSIADQKSTGNDDLSDFQSNRRMRSKRNNKQKNAHEKQPSEMPTKSLKREHSDEKLEKENLKSRFSYVKKFRTQGEVRDHDGSIENAKLFSGNRSPSTTSEDHSFRGSEIGVKSYTPKSDFTINFHSSNVADTDCKTVKSYLSSLRNSKNVMHYVTSISQGQKCSTSVKQIRKGPIIRHLAGMERYAHDSPFERRVTALTFHAKYPSLLAAGSKGGEIILWNTNEATHKLDIPGIGPGGSVLALKFHHENPMIVYTASLTGTVQQQDFLGKDNMLFFDTKDYEIWFPSVDTSVPQKLLLAGDTQGYLHLANLDGKKLWKTKKKVHKGKVTHVEFSTWDPNIFVTASLDHTVQIWDLRMFSNSTADISVGSLHFLKHEKAVNSAYFSPSNGASLLTTDQQNELRVYTAPLWHLENIIPHPHRQFQHLTGIKAQWHPLDDLIVVGRYPDDNFSRCDFRSIDIYDAHSGRREHYFSSNGIVSLNAFSPDGEVLASASGTNVFLRKSEEMCEELSKLTPATCRMLLQMHPVSRSRSNRSKNKLAAPSLQKNKKSKR